MQKLKLSGASLFLFSLLILSCTSIYKEQYIYPDFVNNREKNILLKALKEIEKYRKGELILNIHDQDNKPKPNLKIKYQQISHQFLFGIYESYQTELIQKFKDAGLNYLTLHLNYQFTEPEKGKLELENIENTWNPMALYKLGFSLQGHCLIYMMKEFLPSYLNEADFKTYKAFIQEHIKRLVNQYKDYIKYWNVINEPTSQWSNHKKYSISEIIELIEAGIKIIREEYKDSKIIINHHNPGGERHFYSPLEFTSLLKDKGIDYDIIGLQFYYNAYSKMYKIVMPKRSIDSFSEIIDQYSKFGKDIHITEISVPSEKFPLKPETHGYWNKYWSEETQGEYLKATYTLFFSKKAVKSITWWDGDDNYEFIHSGGLFTKDHKPKQAYNTLKKLITSWTSNGLGYSNKEGKFSFTGFGGKYNITVYNGDKGESLTKELRLYEQEKREVDIIF